MKGTALLLLCAITVAQAAQLRLTLSGKICHCNPEEAASICSSNGSDDELIVHENCNQFYKCAHGSPIPFFCSGETLYNPIAETCDWPQNVDCGNRPIVENESQGDLNPDESEGGQENDTGVGGNCNPEEAPALCAAKDSDGVFVAHEHCNQYYMCASGVPVAMFCSPTLVYNPHTGQCDWPHNVDCQGKPIVEIESGGNDESGNGENEGSNDATCNCNPAEAPDICGAAGSDGTLVAHENCNYFYKCNHGVPVAMPCYGTLLFNPYTEQCDWPQNVDCGDRLIPDCCSGGGNGNEEDCDENGNPAGEDGGTDDNTSSDDGGSANEIDGESQDNDSGTDNGGSGTDNGGSGTDNDESTCNCNPSEAPGICAADGSEGVLIAHENCNKFYKCSHGVPVAMFCYGNLLYNPHTEQCDWPENVDCGDRPIAEVDGGGGNGGDEDCDESDNGTDGGHGDNEGGDNGGSTCNCNPGEAPGICAADGSEGVLIAHENCNKFYKCAHGVPVAMFCYGNLLYNPHTEQCDWPENVDCGDRPIAEVDGGGGNGGDEDCDESDNDTDDNGTDSGNGDNGGGDNGGSTCNCNPSEAPGICAADGSEGVLIAHENCNKFYKCAHGVPVAMFCYGNLLYNPHTEQCDWPENVDCGDRPIAEVDGGGGNGGDEDCDESDNGTDGGNGDNGGGDNGGSTCNCNPGEAPGICAADGSEGVLIAHENCNKFYKCSHGVPVAMFCYGNLLYNPHTEQCDWPENVDCGDRPIAEVDGGGGNGGDEDCDESDNGTDGGNGDNGGGDNGGSTCNCNPGEAPGICTADGSEGVLIAHENCNKFYKCANGEPVALFCNDNLLYNPYTQVCDWPQNVDCGNRTIIEIDGESGNNGGDDTNGSEIDSNNDENCDENGGENGDCNCNSTNVCDAAHPGVFFLPHEHCNQFYQCVHGVPIAHFCPSGLLYRPDMQRCDWPVHVDCGDRPIVDNDAVDKDSDGSDDSDTDNGESTCNCNPDEAPSICGAAGSEGTLVAHHYCNVFYKCASGVPVPIWCSGDLLYNPYTKRCDWPSLVECGQRPIGENEQNPGEDDNDSYEINDIEGSCDPSQAPTICAASGSDGILVAHERCNQFYACANGEPEALNCPSNLLYNPNIKECDWPSNVDCGDRIIPDSGESNGPCACDAKQAPSICADKDSNGKLIAHENCSQYYVCFEGAPVARRCPAGLFYDPPTERCLWAAAVSCEGRQITVLSTYSSLNKHVQARRGLF